MKIEGYKFGQKNNWRRWLWNRIKERLSIPANEALVVYLSGSEDHDRKEAVRRGFRTENLISIDMNDAVIKTIRSKGGIAIKGNVVDIIKQWTSKQKIDVVVADFCGGFSKATGVAFLNSLMAPSGLAPDCVIAVNLLRGRDGDSIWVIKEKGAVNEWCSAEEKHRGIMFFYTLAHWFISIIPLDTKIQLIERGFLACQVIKYVHNPATYSYKSGPNRMDSVVFKWGWLGEKEMEPISGKLSPRISSAMAVRTMRSTGMLKKSPCF